MKDFLEIGQRILKAIKIPDGWKNTVAATCIIALFWADYLSGFSYWCMWNSKADKLIKISQLKQIYKNDSIVVADLNKSERSLLQCRHYSYYVTLFFSEDSVNLSTFGFNDLAKDPKSSSTNLAIRKKTTNSNKPILSLILTVMSSSYLFIIGMLLVLIYPKSYPNKTQIYKILAVPANLIVWLSLIITCSFIAFHIPVIFGRPYINYIIYFLVQLAAMLFIIKKNKGLPGHRSTNA